MNSKENIFKYEYDKIQDSKLNFFYGAAHCYSYFSDSTLSPYETLEKGFKNNLDFMFIIENNSLLHQEITYKSTKISKWASFKTAIKKYGKKHTHPITILGFESKSIKWGDFNIINSKNYFTGMLKNLSLLLLWMLVNEKGFILMNYSHKPGEKLPFNSFLNHFITSVKIRSTRNLKYFYDLLDTGWKLGVVNGYENFPSSENLTCIICNELSIDTITESFRKRRTYYTESKTLKVYFTVNGYFMGETIKEESSEPLDVYVNLQDSKNKIKKIEIITNNGHVIKVLKNIDLFRIKYFIKIPADKKITWLLVKIFQENNKTAITSPIFIENVL